MLSVSLIACNPHSNKIENEKTSFLKPCPGFTETGYPPLVDGAECGELLVNENPDDPQSKKISLNILRLPAISPVPEKDPLFLIQGGPGGSSVDMAAQIHFVFWDVRKNRDLIFVDQRGTGKSNPLNCEKLSPQQMNLPESELLPLLEAIYEDCAKKHAFYSGFYTTPYAVTDLDLVRAELGYEKINLWGGSYGTRVALEYARQYPQRLRTMVLDGLAPVAISLPEYFARDAKASLENISKNCDADKFCAEHYSPVMDKADRIVERLVAAEANTGPLKVNYQNPRYQHSMELSLSVRQFSGLIFSALYSRELSALLPQVLHEAEKGNYQPLANLNFLSEENMKKMSISEGMRYSVICNEDYWLSTQEGRVSSSTFLGYDFKQDISRVCNHWPKTQLPEDYFKPVESNVPGLLLSGGLDPVTPSNWAEQTLEYLPNSRALIAKGGHHIVSYQGCIPQIIAQFIERASMTDINTDCVDKILPLSPDLGASRSKELDNKESDNQDAKLQEQHHDSH